MQFVGHLLGDSMVGNAVWPRSAAARAPALWQATTDPCLCRRHSNHKGRSDSVSVGSLGPGVHKVFFEPLILNAILPLLLSCWGFFFALGHGISFIGVIQHFPVNGCLVVSCNFGVLEREDERMTFYIYLFRKYLFIWLHQVLVVSLGIFSLALWHVESLLWDLGSLVVACWTKHLNT